MVCTIVRWNDILYEGGTVVIFLQGQRNLIKTFHIEGNAMYSDLPNNHAAIFILIIGIKFAA